jgi:DNA-binding NarL/FixJ family response regulator
LVIILHATLTGDGERRKPDLVIARSASAVLKTVPNKGRAMVQYSLRQVAPNDSEARLPVALMAPDASRISLGRDRSCKARVVLIDESPLRRTCTLHLLRARVSKRTQPFAHASQLRAQRLLRAEGPLVVILCAGARSVTDAPIREQMHSLSRDLVSAPIIVMSDREELEEISTAFQDGARGYIPTSLEPHLVIEAIRMVLAGITFVPVTTLIRVRRAREHKTGEPGVDRATIEDRQDWPPRQLAVLRFLVQGKANKEIARALALDESTIKVHVRIIMRKLGVTNRTQAALSVRQLGLSVIPERPLLPFGKNPTAPDSSPSALL